MSSLSFSLTINFFKMAARISFFGMVFALFLVASGCEKSSELDVHSPDYLGQAQLDQSSGLLPEDTEQSRLPVGIPRTGLWLNFYKGASSNQIYFSGSTNGENWREIGGVLNNALTDRAPSVVEFNDAVLLFHRGVYTNEIFLSTRSKDDFFTASWSSNVSLGKGKSSSAPSAVVFNNEVYVFFISSGGFLAYYRSSDGQSYQGPFFINTVSDGGGSGPLLNRSSLSPAAVVSDGRLLVFSMIYQGDGFGDNWIEVIQSDNGNVESWEKPFNSSLGERSSSGLNATTINDGKIILTFSGLTSKKLYGMKITPNPNGGVGLSTPTWINGRYTSEQAGIAFNSQENKMVISYKWGISSGAHHIHSVRALLDGNNADLIDNPHSAVPGSLNYQGRTNAGCSMIFLRP